jgi:hypothetical protein
VSKKEAMNLTKNKSLIFLLSILINTTAALPLESMAQTLSSHADTVPKVKPPMPDMHLEVQSNGEDALRNLGADLDKVAAHHGKTAAELRHQFRQDKSLWADQTGELFFSEKALLSSGSSLATSGTTYPADQTFFLHSRPASKRKVYLNFKGMSLTGTAWNSMAGVTTINAPAYDTDGIPGTFSATELTAIQTMWRTIAEDYAPFDVDITTEPLTTDQMNRTTSTDDTFGAVALITNPSAFPAGFCGGCGGYAYVGVFDSVSTSNSLKIALIFQDNDFWRARSASHEIGHLMGLSHDGTSTTGYYAGNGTGATGWGPIMGHSGNALVQFSKGEYADANNHEDDYLVMQNHGVVFASDDFGNTIATAAKLIPTLTNGFNGFSNYNVNGVIETPTDVDMFQFDANVGSVTIQANPFEVAPNLDILLKLIDANGKVLAQSNPTGALNAAITFAIPAMGSYYISIEGTGEGNPATVGYSKYGSIGRYSISVSAAYVNGVSITPTTPTTPTSSTSWTTCANEGATCSFTGTRQVRYGANGIFVYKTATGSIACNNTAFGRDPLYNTAKFCAYDAGNQTLSVPATTWTNCVSEGGVCSYSGTKQVRYGANGVFFYKTVAGPVGCNNSIFGDPLVGVPKSCAYLN